MVGNNAYRISDLRIISENFLKVSDTLRSFNVRKIHAFKIESKIFTVSE